MEWQIAHWQESVDEFHDKEEIGVVKGLKLALEKIKSQPPADQWIPCSERLPEKPEVWVDSYIVQQRHVYTPFSAYWDGKKWTDEYAEELNNVLAWMPLPEPYKGE